MAEKKKSPSTARPRAKKAPAAEVAPVTTAPVVEAAPIVEAPVQAVPLEVDATPTASKPVAHDAIARRAHEIHLARGGTAFDNWLQAERELRG